MLGLAPDVRIIDLGHDIPPHNVRAGALLLVRAVQYLPDDSIVMAVVDPGVGTDRRLDRASRSRAGSCSGPTTGCSLRPSPWRAGPARVVSLENTEYHLPAPGPDVRRPRHPRPGGRLPGRRRAAHRARAGRRPRGPGARARRPARDRRGRRDRRRGLVGRPLRQLPAQRRPRRARRGRRRARRHRRGAPRQRHPGRPVGAHLRRRQAVGAGAARRLLRPAQPGPRPGVGRQGARPARRAAASPSLPEGATLDGSTP